MLVYKIFYISENKTKKTQSFEYFFPVLKSFFFFFLSLEGNTTNRDRVQNFVWFFYFRGEDRQQIFSERLKSAMFTQCLKGHLRNFISKLQGKKSRLPFSAQSIIPKTPGDIAEIRCQ